MVSFRFFNNLLFCLFSASLSAQLDTTLTISSKAFGGERQIHIFLPETYFENPDQSFAVTYVLDAQYAQFWNMAKSNIDYLANSRTIIPMIAVGIVSENRGSEFRPPATELKAHFKEIFPIIKATYRVNQHRTVVGHSWGGVFIAGTLFGGQKDLFDAYVGISPSMGWKDNLYLNKADSLLRAGYEFNKFLYCTSGDVGRREWEFGAQVSHLDSILQRHPHPTLAWGKTVIENTDHWSCVAPSLCKGLVAMSENYWASQRIIEAFAKNRAQSISSQIEAFYKEKEAIFGFTHRSKSDYFRFIASDFEEMEQFDLAHELYDYALQLDPNNYKAHMGKAYVFVLQEEEEKALRYYKSALPALENSKAKLSEKRFERTKNWLTEKISKME